MKLVFLILAASLTAIESAIQNQLIDSMKAQAAKISSTMPSDYSQLVTDIKSDGFDGHNSSTISDFDAMIATFNFSSQVVAEFKTAIVSESIEFQAFQVEISKDYADVQEFIGAAQNYNGTINIAFLQIFSEGSPVQQYESYHCCSRCWLVGTCCSTCQKEVSMTDAQMITVTDALRATAYTKIMNFLDNPSSEFGNYTLEQQHLENENNWDKLMTSYESCQIQEGSSCELVFDTAVSDCQSQYSESQYDDLCACAIQKVPLSTAWQPCFLCLCARFEIKG